MGASCDKNLARTDVAVLIAILDRINDTRTAWPSLGRIAKDVGADRSTVSRCVRRLVSAGYLLRQSGGFTKSNTYRAGPGKCQPAPSGKAATSGKPATKVGTSSPLGVVASPHHEPTQLNLPSEPVTADAVAPRPADPIWGAGLELLTNKGAPIDKARAALGLCRKVHGQAGTIVLLAQIEREDVSEPLAWLYARLHSKPRGGGRLARDNRTDDEQAEAIDSEMRRLEALRGAPA